MPTLNVVNTAAQLKWVFCSFWVQYVFFLLNTFFIQQGYIKLIRSDSKNIFVVLKVIIWNNVQFEINAGLSDHERVLKNDRFHKNIKLCNGF